MLVELHFGVGFDGQINQGSTFFQVNKESGSNYIVTSDSDPRKRIKKESIGVVEGLYPDMPEALAFKVVCFITEVDTYIGKLQKKILSQVKRMKQNLKTLEASVNAGLSSEALITVDYAKVKDLYSMAEAKVAGLGISIWVISKDGVVVETCVSEELAKDKLNSYYSTISFEDLGLPSPDEKIRDLIAGTKEKSPKATAPEKRGPGRPRKASSEEAPVKVKSKKKLGKTKKKKGPKKSSRED